MFELALSSEAGHGEARRVRFAAVVGVVIFIAVLLPTRVVASGAEEVRRPPHIVVVLADDMGWRDVSYHGSEIPTPSIDRIAKEGIELDRFYAQPTCSPTRAALMTGKSPQRLGIESPIHKGAVVGLPLEETTLATLLANQGYQSLMVGKWHLGHYTPEQSPLARGFEYFYGFLNGGVGYWDHVHGGGYDWQRNGKTLREDGYATHLLVEDAVRVLADRDRSRPTFLYVAFSSPHLPNEAPSASIERFAHLENENRRVHAAMVSELDIAIGRLLEAIRAEGMEDNTIVLFASDNGGLNPGVYAGSAAGTMANFLGEWFDRPFFPPGLEFLAANALDGGSDNSPLPVGKGSVAEGGTRVPAAIWWPGHLERGVHEGFISASDVLPTLLEAIGAKQQIPSDLNGRSQWGALTGDGADPETPDYVVTGMFNEIAIYRSPWKLVDDGEVSLYHIYDDPYEQTDVSAQHPTLLSDLQDTLKGWPRPKVGGINFLNVLLDPDSFGGEEDRLPWADAARANGTR